MHAFFMARIQKNFHTHAAVEKTKKLLGWSAEMEANKFAMLKFVIITLLV